MNELASDNLWTIAPIRLDSVVYPDWHPRFGEIGPVYVYVLRGGSRTLLVDTGIGPPHPLIDRLYQPTRRDLTKALKEAGIAASDIEAVILSHLHFDHVGGAALFPGIPLYVQSAEWEAAQAEKYTIPEFLTFSGANFVHLAGDAEVAPGVAVRLSGDHSPGHQVVFVSTPSGTVVLAGQAIETTSEFVAMQERGTLPPMAQRIVDARPSQVWFSHDETHWEPAVPG